MQICIECIFFLHISVGFENNPMIFDGLLSSNLKILSLAHRHAL